MHPARPVSIALVVVLGALGVAESAHAIGRSHVRDGWMYGLNLGWGWARAEAVEAGNPEPLESDWTDDLTGGLRVAFAPGEQLAYGLDFSGWTDKAGQLDETVFWILVQGHWFPRGQGFFVRGGAGLGTVNVTYRGPQVLVSRSKGGFAFGLGAGYEVRFSDTFALGVAYDYRQVDVSAIETLEDVTTRIHGVTLNLNWYMD